MAMATQPLAAVSHFKRIVLDLHFFRPPQHPLHTMSRSPSSVRSTTHVRTPQGDATQLPLALFLNNVLPPLPTDIDPLRLVHILTSSYPKSSSQKAITSKGRWRGFAQDPAESWQREKESFRHLKGIVHSILKAGGHPLPVAFYQTPSDASSSRGRLEQYLPDSLLLSEPDMCWDNVVTFGELQKHDSDADVQEVRATIIASTGLS